MAVEVFFTEIRGIRLPNFRPAKASGPQDRTQEETMVVLEQKPAES